MDSARASSVVNASSHLVSSKHDAKCRRVPRIISRRLYRYRRKVPSQKPFVFTSTSHLRQNEREFSPRFLLDLPKLEETLLGFLIKYPQKRSHSTDSDPLVLFRSEMNKSAFFNHNLMKRRYSVPETVMRKHKLQENSYRKTANSSATSDCGTPKTDEKLVGEMNVRDESCQTDEHFDYVNSFKGNASFRKNSKCRKRDSARHFRKCNSYCQYKSLSMFHKKMSNRQREAHSVGSFETLTCVEPTRKKEQNSSPTNGVGETTKRDSQPLPTITTKSDDPLVREKFVDILLDDQSINAPAVNNLQKSHSDKTISPLRRLSPIVRQCSYPPLLQSLDSSKYLFDFSSKPKIIFCKNGGHPKIENVETFSFVRRRPERVFVKSAKSLDQNTSGYSTVNGSLDETPRRKTPETPQCESAAANDEPPRKSNEKPSHENERNKSADTFPITFHSESVFLHPYENGFLSHKELHHISIQKVADCGIETSNVANSQRDYHKTEIKLNVNECEVPSAADEKSAGVAADDRTARAKGENKLSEPIPRGPAEKSETLDSKERFETEASRKADRKTNVPTEIPTTGYDESKKPQRDGALGTMEEACLNGDTNSIRSDDCTVPAPGHPFKSDEQSKLRIEVDVTDVDLSKGLQQVLVGRRDGERRRLGTAEGRTVCDSRKDETKNQPNKYSSRTALNYLFQKLGDTYPKRSLLKQPSFHEDHARYPPYYSDLPRIDYPHIPSKVLFNNRTYDILSEKLLPSELSTSSASKRYDSADINFPNVSQIRRLSADRDERLSDSDTSIADSLEDFQQTKSKYHNKYDRYDERVARGEVRHTNARAKFNKCRGSISYFIPLDGLNGSPSSVMPAKLMEKLRKRGRSISKHSSCVDSRKRPSKPAKLIHKQIQTSFNGENSPIRRRDVKNVALKEAPQMPDSGGASKDLELDARIMNILLSGLRMQETAVTGAEQVEEGVKSGRLNRKDANVDVVQTFPDTSSRSVQTEGSEQTNRPVMSEYIEILKVSSPVDHVLRSVSDDDKDEEESRPSRSFSQTEDASSDSLYEMIQSEEEIANINSTNYYRSVKKSRRIYYPTKFENKRFSYERKNNESSFPFSGPNVPSFSKYQKNLREFKEQMKRQNNDKIHATHFGDSAAENSGGHEIALLPYQHMRTRKLKDKHQFKNLITKISGPRPGRFRQRFEAIPEETLSSTCEAIDQNRDTLHRSSVDEKSQPNTSPMEDLNMNEPNNVGNDPSRIEPLIVTSSNENQMVTAKSSYHNRDDNEDDFVASDVPENDGYKGKVKSQKGRDSLSTVNEQEELITLSRGWINFYLLNGNNTEENIGTNEEAENENVALSETLCIPQQFTVHVHAKPEIPSTEVHKSKSNSLPGLSKLSKNRAGTKFGRTKQKIKTNSLFGIGGNAHSPHKTYDVNSNDRQRNLLPKLNRNSQTQITHCDEKLEEARSHFESNVEPVSTGPNCLQIEKSSSTAVSSNHSESSIDEHGERNKIERQQNYQRPHTYHSTRTNNQWSVTIEGSHAYEERMASEIEMQLCLKKNNPRGSSVSNQSWRFSIRNEEHSQSDDFDERRIKGRRLPYLNVTRGRPALRINEDENSNYSDNNTRSNSTLSFHERMEFNRCDHSSAQNIKKNGRFSADLKAQLKSSDDDLTVTGSAITPERKSRVPVLSERDLYRMKLLKQVSVEHKLM